MSGWLNPPSTFLRSRAMKISTVRGIFLEYDASLEGGKHGLLAGEVSIDGGAADAHGGAEVLVALGHGIWLLCATVIRAIAGS